MCLLLLFWCQAVNGTRLSGLKFRLTRMSITMRSFLDMAFSVLTLLCIVPVETDAANLSFDERKYAAPKFYLSLKISLHFE